MMMAEYGDDADGSSGFSRWVIPALIVSLLLHGGFWYWASGVPVNQHAQEMYEKFVPRAFQIQRAEIDPELLKPEPADERRQPLAPEAVNLPTDRAAFQKLMAENTGDPAAPKIDQVILSEKPTAAATTLDQAMLTAQRNGAQSVLQDSLSLNKALLADQPASGSRPNGAVVAPDALTGRAITRDGPLQGGDQPGFSNLDELLARTGPLSPGTAPILMPTDLLFDYDQAALQQAAVASLEKLGLLIRRNPQATFLIEGHTDSFGPDDYNLALSQRRADIVKMWLVTVMKIPPGRVESRGFGETQLIAPSSGTIDEQKLNRRVEIVIRDKKGD